MPTFSRCRTPEPLCDALFRVRMFRSSHVFVVDCQTHCHRRFQSPSSFYIRVSLILEILEIRLTPPLSLNFFFESLKLLTDFDHSFRKILTGCPSAISNVFQGTALCLRTLPPPPMNGKELNTNIFQKQLLNFEYSQINFVASN